MKILILLLLFINTLFASIIQDVYILEDNPTLNFENIKTNTDFKKTPKYIQRETQNQYWIKIKIDQTKMEKDQEYLLKVDSRFEINKIEFDKKLKKSFLDKDTIKIEDQYIYFRIINLQNYVNIDIKDYTKKEIYEEKIQKTAIFNIAYGIVFSAFLYYLAFYIFNRQKSFIYYALTQLSMLCLLAANFESLDNLFILSFIIFSILFTKEFLNTKKYTPKLDKILTFMIFFYIVDTLLDDLMSDIFPSSIFLLVYILSAVIIYNKTKSKPILFYIGGWSLVIFTFVFIDAQFYFSDVVQFNILFDVVVHVIAPLESLILAFSLSYKMKLLEEEKLEFERKMVHQNKLAAMGEMISNIAHQWRQPLTHLSYIMMNINTAFKQDKLSEKYLDKKTNQATDQLEYMSNTIDDFKNFYMPKTHKEEFSIKSSIENTLTIISSTLETNKINLEINGEDFNINGYKSEFSQVLLNLISNAKDALVKNGIQNPKIEITLNKNQITICDNAGGIDEKTKEKIFDPYFTTKQKGNGLGLYMSKIIIESHFAGKLNHFNKNGGSCFVISF